MLSSVSENIQISSYCCRVKGKRLMRLKTAAYKRSRIIGHFYFFWKGKNVISWPTLKRNFLKEAELLCMSTGSSLIETPCFVVLCYCIVIVHRSPWQPLTQKAWQFKGGNKERNNCIKFVYPLNEVAIFPTICHKVIVLLSSCSKF